jgi:hypothetical protein
VCVRPIVVIRYRIETRDPGAAAAVTEEQEDQMGAHSATGHGSTRTVTAAAGLAAALVTTAATGLLTGGTAFATDGWDAHGSGHSHSHGSDSGWDAERTSDSDRGLASQTWCDALGDVDLGDDYSCDGSSDDSGDDDAATASSAAATSSRAAATSSHAVAATSPAPAPAPRPTSSVPDHPTVQPIVAPPSGRRVVPISSRM